MVKEKKKQKKNKYVERKKDIRKRKKGKSKIESFVFDFGDFEESFSRTLEDTFPIQYWRQNFACMCSIFHCCGYREATHITYVEESILSLTHLHIHVLIYSVRSATVYLDTLITWQAWITYFLKYQKYTALIFCIYLICDYNCSAAPIYTGSEFENIRIIKITALVSTGILLHILGEQDYCVMVATWPFKNSKWHPVHKV